MVNTITFDSIEDKLNHLKSLEKIPSINPRVYNEDDEYYRLDFISHPQFGTGFIEEILSDTEIKVFFPHGVEVLGQKSYLIHHKIS